MIQLRLPRRWTAVAILVFATVTILVLLNPERIRIAYHKHLMQAARTEFVDSLIGGYSGESAMFRYEHHRDKLVALGYLEHKRFQFSALIAQSEESRHFLTHLRDDFCPEHVDWSSLHSGQPEPLSLEVWCPPHESNSWEEFVSARDVADYRERYMRE